MFTETQVSSAVVNLPQEQDCEFFLNIFASPFHGLFSLCLCSPNQGFIGLFVSDTLYIIEDSMESLECGYFSDEFQLVPISPVGRPARLGLGPVSAELATMSRSEERRVGKECLRLCRSRWSPYH